MAYTAIWQVSGGFHQASWPTDPGADAQSTAAPADSTLRYAGPSAEVPQALRAEIIAATPASPNGTGFRTAIAQTASYQAWVDSLPQHRAISLAIAAANDNWAEVQAIYNAAVAITPPAAGARAEWQAIAAANHIPLDFGSD